MKRLFKEVSITIINCIEDVISCSFQLSNNVEGLNQDDDLMSEDN